jgi:hypothetical protein
MRLMLFFLFSISAFAQNFETNPQCAPCPQVEVKKDTTSYRANSFGQLMIGYQHVDSWVFGKTTASYTQILSRGWSLELEYGMAKRDIEIFKTDMGEITDQRLTLLTKFYVGNSFHFSFGPYANRLDIKTKGRLEDRFGNLFNDRLVFNSYGLSLGFGNRWQTTWGLTYGIDWLRANTPIVIGEVKQRLVELGDEDRVRVDKIFEVFRSIPTFTLFGVNIGYTF